jgi:hypothetical protein
MGKNVLWIGSLCRKKESPMDSAGHGKLQGLYITKDNFLEVNVSDNPYQLRKATNMEKENCINPVALGMKVILSMDAALGLAGIIGLRVVNTTVILSVIFFGDPL